MKTVTGYKISAFQAAGKEMQCAIHLHKKGLYNTPLHNFIQNKIKCL